jgi:hypothetical protein
MVGALLTSIEQLVREESFSEGSLRAGSSDMSETLQERKKQEQNGPCKISKDAFPKVRLGRDGPGGR